MNKTTPDASTLKNFEGAMGDTVHGFVHKGTEAVDHIKIRVVEITDQARTKGMDFYDRAVELIKKKPFQAIGVAFGVGYAAMRINTSRLTPVAVLGALSYLGVKILRYEPLER